MVTYLGRESRLVVPTLATLMVALLAAGWLFSGYLVHEAPALAVAAGRTATSFVVIVLLAGLFRSSWPDVRTAASRTGTVLILAFLGFFAYYSGTLFGVVLIGASQVNVIVSLLPCLTFLIGIAVFRELASRRKALGTALAVTAAVGFGLADGAAAGGIGLGTLLSGGLLALGGTFTYALYGYVYRQRMAGLAPIAALPAITGAGTVMLGFAAVGFVPLGEVTLADWGGIAILGAVLTAPVFLLSHELILRKGPLFTSAVALVVPFLVRLGEWALGWAGPPSLLVLALIFLCTAGVWLTVADTRPVASTPTSPVATPEPHSSRGSP